MKSWSRLVKYGKLVRKLKISDNKDVILDSNAMETLSMQRPVISLTPNLQHMVVEWQNGDILKYCYLFFNENVQSLTLSVPSLDLSPFSYILERAIFSRATGLKLLNIETRKPLHDGDINITLNCASPYMRNIETLILPQFCLTTSILNQSEVVGKLKKILRNDSLACNAPAASMEPRNPLGPVIRSKLEELHIGARFRSLRSLAPRNFPKLISLYIDFLWQTEDSDSLRDLTKKISDNFSGLQQLSIMASRLKRSQLDMTKTISSDPLKALTTMKNLKFFSFQWCTPIVCTNEELMEVLEGLPSIEVLLLNERPIFTDGGTDITLDVLPFIARACPNLRKIALFVDCTVPPGASFSGPFSQRKAKPITERVLFTKLESFDLGSSPVLRDPFNIAHRLYDTLPTKCKLSKPAQVAKAETTLNTTQAATTWENICEDVSELMSALSVGREEERRRSDKTYRVLEKKIVKAEERIKELESLHQA